MSDDALRARLWRAAETRMRTSTPSTRDRAGQACLETIAELRRRRTPLTGRTTGSTVDSTVGSTASSGSSCRVTTST